MKEKKNEIFIIKNGGGYTLRYRGEDKCTEPRYVVNTMEFYDIINGLIERMPKNIYKEGIKEIHFNEEYAYNKISEKEKKIFKRLINILERFVIGEKSLEYKIEEIKKTLIKKEDRKKFLEVEISRNEKESFNSLYKIIKK